MTADRTRKKTAAKKTAAKRAPAKKAPAKKTAAKKTAATEQEPRRQASAPRAESKPRPSAVDVADRAARELSELTHKTPEAVIGVERTDDGWRVTVEVLEMRRIPETTDVLACYEVETDDQGALTSYHRAGRYTRGSTQED